MDKYIKLIDICEANDCFNEEYDCDNCVFNKIPAADVQPVKRGKWEHDRCTECKTSLEELFSGDFYYNYNEIKFCPNCGADMRGEKDE